MSAAIASYTPASSSSSFVKAASSGSDGCVTVCPPAGPAAELTYSIVRERVTLRVHRTAKRALMASAEPRKAFCFRELEQIAIPSPHRRAIAKMIQEVFNQG